MKRITALLLLIPLVLLPACSLNGAGETPCDVPTVTDADFIPLTDGETGVFSQITDEAQPSGESTATQSSSTVKNVITAAATTLAAVVTTTAAKPVSASSSATKPTAAKPSTSATAAQPTSPPAAATTAAKPVISPSPSNELRGIWLSCFEFPSAQGKTREQFAAAADTIFKNIASLGLNAAFVHVRPFSDSIYPSDIFPWSKYISGEQGKNPGYDTLAILLSAAKKYGIAFHAWINPFRVATDSDYTKLAPSNPARKIIESGNADGDVCVLSNGIYYCPASTAMHELILSGVKEILSKYDVDGIHIDDYFYPSASESVPPEEVYFLY